MGRTSEDLWQEYRRRMLAETERFIEWGLRHPEMVDWIPSKPIRAGGFPRAVSEWFFRTVFLAKESGKINSWREKLRGLKSRLGP